MRQVATLQLLFRKAQLREHRPASPHSIRSLLTVSPDLAWYVTDISIASRDAGIIQLYYTDAHDIVEKKPSTVRARPAVSFTVSPQYEIIRQSVPAASSAFQAYRRDYLDVCTSALMISRGTIALDPHASCQ